MDTTSERITKLEYQMTSFEANLKSLDDDLSSLSNKLDALSAQITELRISASKYVGMATVLLAVAQFIASHYFK